MTSEASTTFEMQCEECEALFDEGDAGPAGYECSRCGTEFSRDDSADGDSSRCPNCNIFSAKISDCSCPECGSLSMDSGEFSPPPPPTEEEIAEGAARQQRSEARLREYMEDHEERRRISTERWAGENGLARAFNGIGKLEWWTATLFSDQALSLNLQVSEAETIARVILGEEDREMGWGELARAFDGIELEQGSYNDLGAMLEYAFGKLGAVGTSVEEAGWAMMARRLLAS